MAFVIEVNVTAFLFYGDVMIIPCCFFMNQNPAGADWIGFHTICFVNIYLEINNPKYFKLFIGNRSKKRYFFPLCGDYMFPRIHFIGSAPVNGTAYFMLRYVAAFGWWRICFRCLQRGCKKSNGKIKSCAWVHFKKKREIDQFWHKTALLRYMALKYICSHQHIFP